MNQLQTSIAVVIIALSSANLALAQNPGNASLQRDIDQLRSRVRQVESDNQQLEQNQRKLLNQSGGTGVLILFGVVCALWAQNTGRNPWLWFFLGLFFSFITACFLLSKNATDLRQNRTEKPFS